MGKSTFELDDKDAAIIIRHDMSTEIVIPKLDDAENVNFEDNQNLFIVLAISGSMGDEDFRKVIGAKLDEMFSKAEEDGVGGCSDPTDDDTEGPSCGGCQGCG